MTLCFWGAPETLRCLFVFGILMALIACNSIPKTKATVEEMHKVSYEHNIFPRPFDTDKDTILFRQVGRVVVPFLFIKDGKFLTEEDIDFRKMTFPLRVYPIKDDGTAETVFPVYLSKQYVIRVYSYLSDLYYRSATKDDQYRCLKELKHNGIMGSPKPRSKKCIYSADNEVLGCSNEPLFVVKGWTAGERELFFSSRPLKLKPASDDGPFRVLTKFYSLGGDTYNSNALLPQYQFESDINGNGIPELWLTDFAKMEFQVWENFRGTAPALVFNQPITATSEYSELVFANECDCMRTQSDGKCYAAW